MNHAGTVRGLLLLFLLFICSKVNNGYWNSVRKKCNFEKNQITYESNIIIKNEQIEFTKKKENVN